MESPIISIKDLTYRYRGQKRNAIEHITLDVMPGEFIAIMGASEAGKSTLAACINGLIPHFFRGKFSGEVEVCGKNTCSSRVAEMAEVTGMVFQDFEAQLFSTNVELEVAFGLENFNVPRDEISRRVNEALQFVGLEGLRRRSPATLSGGQKQKLAIASVLAMYPKILVMDEPTTDLDPISKAGIFEIANHLRQRDDLTLLVVEHETEEVLTAQKIALLDEGKLIRLAPAQELLREVDLLESHGVMPLGVTKYFYHMGIKNDAPLNVDDGIKKFHERQWHLSDPVYETLKNQERAREQKYGAPLIRCENLQFAYPNGTHALKGIDLEIRRGEMVAIVGQNGSGKTTLLKMVNRLIEPSAGRIYLDGVDIQTLPVTQLRRRIGYVIQQVGLFPHLTVAKNIAVVPELLGWPREKIEARIDELLDMVHLPRSFRQRYPAQLSGGQQQRVGLARALAADPEVLLMDEPFGAIDAITRTSLQDQVLELQRRLRKTILFVTHDVDEALKLADRILVLNQGRLVQFDTPCALLNRPADAFVRRLLNTEDRIRQLGLMRVETVMSPLRRVNGWAHQPRLPIESDLRQALSVLLQPGVESVIVMDSAGQPRGQITFEDLRQRLGCRPEGAP
ncbi:MAG: energy-coupling factor transporter ATPase [Thermanaerothrix sp.]|nr:energy-coupling factor transporter ATPase [Thermanaerothrix sp.]